MQDDDIDKELLTPVDELRDEPPVPKKRVVRRVKPAVEGINAPKTTRSNVVVKTARSDEREERLVPERVWKKRPHIGRLLAIFILLLVIIAAGYEAYVWNLNRHVLPVPSYAQQYSSTATDNATSSLDVAPVASSTPVAASSTPATTASSTPPAAPVPQLTINQTPTGYLNVRSTPSTSGKLLTQVNPGDTYPYTSTQNGWYQITLKDGSSGWVTGQYVTVNK